jgi:uncharacterized protein YgiM (DUF1202 family)
MSAKILTAVLNVRSGPGMQYAQVSTVKKNQVIPIIQQSGNWGKLKSGAGWICLDYTDKATTPKAKSNEQIADEVIQGLWGTGKDRKNRLTKAGYDYDTIQSIVNKKLGK